MKKVLAISIAGAFFGLIVSVVLLAGIAGGGAGSVVSPLIAFAEEDEAYEYQYIGSELGVPWDIIMLADGIHAYAAGESDLSGYNPMLTSLEFCILQEEKYVLEEPEEEEAEEGKNEEDKNGNKVDGDKKPELPEEEKKEPVWEYEDTFYYTGTDEILEYLDMDSDSDELTYAYAASLVKDLYAAAEDKGTSDTKYEVTLLENPDYEAVLEDRIGLQEKDISYVMEIYNTSYLALLYGYTVPIGDIELPDIVVGDVSREELAQVAVSLINHPYCMGGKSSQQGAPIGPLDCSGYVDWVYVQCFGVTVGNGGKLPEGVAVAGTAIQWYSCEPIGKKELQVGDLGFKKDPAVLKDGQINHVGIYLGKSGNKEYWIHCGGKAFGTAESPSGRVGISVVSGENDYNPVSGGSFSPAMKGCNFTYYRRPRFAFRE